MRVPPLVFEIPCPHPAAEGGVFYCEATYFNAHHMKGGFEYIIADTKKLVAQLRKDDPKMLEHAKHKFSGETAAEWLAQNSRENAPEMGHWVYSRERGLTMSSGNAGLIQLAQEISIPFFPIAIEKASGHAAIAELRKKIETKDGHVYNFVQIKFRPDDPRSPDFGGHAHG